MPNRFAHDTLELGVRKVVLLRLMAAVLALGAATAACGGGWRRVEDMTPRTFPTRAQVQVWRGDSFTLLHALRLNSEKITGVPFTQAPTCDSCRVEFALGAVDSLRAGSKERAVVRTTGLVVAIGLLWAYLFRGVGGD
jgi:hypothetical protein